MLIGDAWRCAVYSVADALTGGRRERGCKHDCLACAIAEEIANPSAEPELEADTYAGQVPRPEKWPTR